MTRDEHLSDLMDEYSVHPDTVSDLRDIGKRRWALVEGDEYGNHWITLHETDRAAQQYYAGQESPELWGPLWLVDLETGRRIEVCREYTLEHMEASIPESPGQEEPLAPIPTADEIGHNTVLAAREIMGLPAREDSK